MIEARDTGTPEATPGGSGRDFWPEDKPARRRPQPKLLIGAAAVLAVVVVAVVAAVALTGGDGGKKEKGATGNGAQVLPTAYTPDFDGQGFAKLASRRADQRQVTEGEAFSGDARTVTAGKYSFTLAGSQLSSDCKAVTWGARLQGDLAEHGCTQIARAAYVSNDKQHVGQFIAINLASEEGVKQILRDLDRATGSGWVLPLAASGAPAFGAGFSAAYAKTYGHFVVISWVQRAGGVQPASLNEMIDTSLAIEKPADFVWGRLQMIDDAKQ